MPSPLETLFASQLAAAGLPTPAREMAFLDTRAWRFDFAWPAAQVAVEIEGGTYTHGRHTRPAGFEEDCRKYNTAALHGWTVLRATGAMVRSGEALQAAAQALAPFAEPAATTDRSAP